MKSFDSLISVLSKPWFAILYLSLVVISFLYFDKLIAYYFHDLNLEVNFPFLYWLTNVGLGGTYLILFPILALLFRYAYKEPTWEVRCWFLWLCVLIPGVVTLILKNLFGRSRPHLLFSDQIFGFHGFRGFTLHSDYWSFPSGHTTTMMGLAFGLCIVFPRYAYGFLAAGLTVSFSRVLLTNHYLSDVLLTSYLVFVEMAVLYIWLKRKRCLNKISANSLTCSNT